MAFGAPADVIEEWEEASSEPDEGFFEVWPENWDSLQFFLKLQTQWRVGPTGTYTGLDYSAVETLMRIHKVQRRSEIMDAVQILEISALKSLRNGS